MLKYCYSIFIIRGDEINDSQPMEQYLESYLERWLNSVENPSIGNP